MTRARFLVETEALEGPTLQLRGTELHHFRSRRLRPGSVVILTDGKGRERAGVVASVTRMAAEVLLQRADELQYAGESPLTLHLAQAALKADKLDLVIEKATEFGVTQLTVFTSARCVARPPSSRLERWQRVAKSAAKQSQRSVIPAVRGPVPLDEVLGSAPEALRLLFWEQARSTGSRWTELSVTSAGVLAAVGPEGGFDDAEVSAARQAGFRIVGFGPRVLRAETAAIAAVALAQRTWGDL